MGLLDDIFGGLAPDLVALFVDTAQTITRIESSYDPHTDRTVDIDTQTGSVKMTPPEAVSRRDVDGEVILPTDKKVFIPKQNLDDITFDINPTTSVRVLITVNGRDYRVVAPVVDVYSGDSIVGYTVFLR